MKERLKTTTTEDKIMREMITTYHTKVMTELTKIKQDVATIRSTPVEIVATHERPVTHRKILATLLPDCCIAVG